MQIASLGEKSVKWQSQFSGKTIKNIINLLSAESVQRQVKVNAEVPNEMQSYQL